MYLFKNIFNFFIGLLFLASCSSMNVTEEKVYSSDVKTIEASSFNLSLIHI